MLRRVIRYEEEFTLALDSILDKILLFLHMNCIETLRYQPNYMTSNGRGVKKYVVHDGEEGAKKLQQQPPPSTEKNIYELIHDFFPHLDVVYNPSQIFIQVGIMLRSMVMVLTRLAPMEDRYHVGYKRYNASGALCADLFSKLLKQYLKSKVKTSETIQCF